MLNLASGAGSPWQAVLEFGKPLAAHYALIFPLFFIARHTNVDALTGMFAPTDFPFAHPVAPSLRRLLARARQLFMWAMAHVFNIAASYFLMSFFHLQNMSTPALAMCIVALVGLVGNFLRNALPDEDMLDPTVKRPPTPTNSSECTESRSTSGVVSVGAPDYLHAGAPHVSTLCIGVALSPPAFLLLSLGFRRLLSSLNVAHTMSATLSILTTSVVSVLTLFLLYVVTTEWQKERKSSADTPATRRRSKRWLGCD